MRFSRTMAGWWLTAGLVATACAPLAVTVGAPTGGASALPGSPLPGPTVPVASAGTYDPERVAPNVIAERLKQGEKFLPVDVRSVDAYMTEHLEGAVSAPWATIIAGKADLPKDQTLLLYCT